MQYIFRLFKQTVCSKMRIAKSTKKVLIDGVEMPYDRKYDRVRNVNLISSIFQEKKQHYCAEVLQNVGRDGDYLHYKDNCKCIVCYKKTLDKGPERFRILDYPHMQAKLLCMKDQLLYDVSIEMPFNEFEKLTESYGFSSYDSYMTTEANKRVWNLLFPRVPIVTRLGALMTEIRTIAHGGGIQSTKNASFLKSDYQKTRHDLITQMQRRVDDEFNMREFIETVGSESVLEMELKFQEKIKSHAKNCRPCNFYFDCKDKFPKISNFIKHVFIHDYIMKKVFVGFGKIRNRVFDITQYPYFEGFDKSSKERIFVSRISRANARIHAARTGEYKENYLLENENLKKKYIEFNTEFFQFLTESEKEPMRALETRTSTNFENFKMKIKTDLMIQKRKHHISISRSSNQQEESLIFNSKKELKSIVSTISKKRNIKLNKFGSEKLVKQRFDCKLELSNYAKQIVSDVRSGFDVYYGPGPRRKTYNKTWLKLVQEIRDKEISKERNLRRTEILYQVLNETKGKAGLKKYIDMEWLRKCNHVIKDFCEKNDIRYDQLAVFEQYGHCEEQINKTKHRPAWGVHSWFYLQAKEIPFKCHIIQNYADKDRLNELVEVENIIKKQDKDGMYLDKAVVELDFRFELFGGFELDNSKINEYISANISQDKKDAFNTIRQDYEKKRKELRNSLESLELLNKLHSERLEPYKSIVYYSEILKRVAIRSLRRKWYIEGTVGMSDNTTLTSLKWLRYKYDNIRIWLQPGSKVFVYYKFNNYYGNVSGGNVTGKMRSVGTKFETTKLYSGYVTRFLEGKVEVSFREKIELKMEGRRNSFIPATNLVPYCVVFENKRDFDKLRVYQETMEESERQRNVEKKLAEEKLLNRRSIINEALHHDMMERERVERQTKIDDERNDIINNYTQAQKCEHFNTFWKDLRIGERAGNQQVLKDLVARLGRDDTLLNVFFACKTAWERTDHRDGLMIQYSGLIQKKFSNAQVNLASTILYKKLLTYSEAAVQLYLINGMESHDTPVSKKKYLENFLVDWKGSETRSNNRQKKESRDSSGSMSSTVSFSERTQRKVVRRIIQNLLDGITSMDEDALLSRERDPGIRKYILSELNNDTEIRMKTCIDYSSSDWQQEVIKSAQKIEHMHFNQIENFIKQKLRQDVVNKKVQDYQCSDYDMKYREDNIMPYPTNEDLRKELKFLKDKRFAMGPGSWYTINEESDLMRVTGITNEERMVLAKQLEIHRPRPDQKRYRQELRRKVKMNLMDTKKDIMARVDTIYNLSLFEQIQLATEYNKVNSTLWYMDKNGDNVHEETKHGVNLLDRTADALERKKCIELNIQTRNNRHKIHEAEEDIETFKRRINSLHPEGTYWGNYFSKTNMTLSDVGAIGSSTTSEVAKYVSQYERLLSKSDALKHSVENKYKWKASDGDGSIRIVDDCVGSFETNGFIENDDFQLVRNNTSYPTHLRLNRVYCDTRSGKENSKSYKKLVPFFIVSLYEKKGDVYELLPVVNRGNRIFEGMHDKFKDVPNFIVRRKNLIKQQNELKILRQQELPRDIVILMQKEKLQVERQIDTLKIQQKRTETSRRLAELVRSAVRDPQMEEQIKLLEKKQKESVLGKKLTELEHVLSTKFVDIEKTQLQSRREAILLKEEKIEKLREELYVPFSEASYGGFTSSLCLSKSEFDDLTLTQLTGTDEVRLFTAAPIPFLVKYHDILYDERKKQMREVLVKEKKVALQRVATAKDSSDSSDYSDSSDSSDSSDDDEADDVSAPLFPGLLRVTGVDLTKNGFLIGEHNFDKDGQKTEHTGLFLLDGKLKYRAILEGEFVTSSIYNNVVAFAEHSPDKFSLIESSPEWRLKVLTLKDRHISVLFDEKLPENTDMLQWCGDDVIVIVRNEIWRFVNGCGKYILNVGSKLIRSICSSENFIVTGLVGGHIIKWDKSTDSTEKLATEHKETVTDLVCKKGSGYMVSSSLQTVCVWRDWKLKFKFDKRSLGIPKKFADEKIELGIVDGTLLYFCGKMLGKISVKTGEQKKFSQRVQWVMSKLVHSNTVDELPNAVPAEVSQDIWNGVLHNEDGSFTDDAIENLNIYSTLDRREGYGKALIELEKLKKTDEKDKTYYEKEGNLWTRTFENELVPFKEELDDDDEEKRKQAREYGMNAILEAYAAANIGKEPADEEVQEEERRFRELYSYRKPVSGVTESDGDAERAAGGGEGEAAEKERQRRLFREKEQADRERLAMKDPFNSEDSDEYNVYSDEEFNKELDKIESETSKTK